MKIGRGLKIVCLALVLVTTSLLWLSCKSGTGTTASQQTTAVQRGNITTLITGTGNLAFSTTQDLAFGQSGQVAEIGVRAGDNITKGQVLARLDTTDLEQAVSSANLSVQSAGVSLTVAQNNQSNITDQELAVQSAQIALATAQNAQSGITSSQIDLETANNNLAKISYPYTFTTFNLNIPNAISAIHGAQLALNLASADLQASSPNYGNALQRFQAALTSLSEAQGNLLMGTSIDNFLSTANQSRAGSSTSASVFAVADFWTITAAQQALQKAQITLDNAKRSYQTGLDNANLTLKKAQQSLAEAKNSYSTSLAQANLNLATAKNNLAKAQRNLDEAVITTPFTGIVTAVNISAGQLVGSGQVAIAIADPGKLEANVLVNEIDIPWVLEGGRATLQLDAVPGVTIPAEISAVAPTATIQSGVVNYAVTLALNSAVINPAQAASGNQTRQAPAGGQARQGSGSTPRPGSQRVQQGSPANIVLRQGLSVTGNIIKEQRTGVLMVPSRAVGQQGTTSYVQFLKSDGTTEQRLVQTGLTDGLNTEITSGLSEGDTILAQAKPSTTTTTTAPQFRPGGGGIRIGG